MRDIGSSSGTFLNQVRLSPPNQMSAEVQIFTGDYIQLGKDFQDDSPLDQYGRVAGMLFYIIDFSLFPCST